MSAAVVTEAQAPGSRRDTKAYRAEQLLFWRFMDEDAPVLVSEIVRLGAREGLTYEDLYRAAVRFGLDRLKRAGTSRPVAAWAPPGWKRGDPRHPAV